jgi:hypothetical protein
MTTPTPNPDFSDSPISNKNELKKVIPDLEKPVATKQPFFLLPFFFFLQMSGLKKQFILACENPQTSRSCNENVRKYFFYK